MSLRYIFSLIQRWYTRRRRRGHFLETIVPIRGAALGRFLEAADIGILDVGARGGPWWAFASVRQFARLYLVEPDRSEAEKLSAQMARAGWKNPTIIPEAFGQGPGAAVLRLTREPGLSSLLEPNRPVIQQYYPHEGSPKFRAINWDVLEERDVPMVTLDSIAQTHGARDLSIIKLDTQGTELDILQSGRELVLPSLVAVLTEVEFVPLYRGQPLFGDVHAFLEGEGFRLFDLKRTMLRRRNQMPVPYSKRELVYAHALYLRERTRDGAPLAPKDLHRLAAAAIALECYDYAVSILDQSAFASYLETLDIDAQDARTDLLRHAGRVRATLSRGLDTHERDRMFTDALADRTEER